MTEPIIQAKGLTKDYKNNRAVDSLDLEIKTGDLFGLVGPDGAGKTTTLRLLAGLLDITSGTASVCGFDLRRQPEAVKPKIGYMAQQFSLYGELSVVENLDFFADLYDVDLQIIKERKERLLDFAGLMEFKSRRAALLSGGMQKKLALACTLIHQPPILLLDEPTTGVDPISRREFWHILTDLHLDGTTILISTPYMDEADRCSTVGLMYAGNIIECAPPAEIQEKIEGEMIEIYPSDWQKARVMISKVEGVREIQTYGESLHILVDSAENRLPLIETCLHKEGIPYSGARKAPRRMEEAFISLIQKIRAEEEGDSPSIKRLDQS